MTAEFLLVSRSCCIRYAKLFLIFCSEMYLIGSFLCLMRKSIEDPFCLAAMFDYDTGFLGGLMTNTDCKLMFYSRKLSIAVC